MARAEARTASRLMSGLLCDSLMEGAAYSAL